MNKIEKAEIRERDVVSFNLERLGITEIVFSEIGSYSPWDMKYKRDGEWFVCNVKIFQHTSEQPFDYSKWNRSWKSNPIDGHPVKRSVLERLMNITMNERFEDQEIIKVDEKANIVNTFTNYYRPTMMYMFSDGVVLEWMIDELPIAWCPVSNSFKSTHFVWAWNPKTQNDWTLVENQFYGLRPEIANRYEWSEPKRQLRSWRNEDLCHDDLITNYINYFQDPKMK